MAGVSRLDTIAARLQKFRRKAQPLSATSKHAGLFGISAEHEEFEFCRFAKRTRCETWQGASVALGDLSQQIGSAVVYVRRCYGNVTAFGHVTIRSVSSLTSSG
jgi:hypothetical protein